MSVRQYGWDFVDVFDRDGKLIDSFTGSDAFGHTPGPVSFPAVNGYLKVEFRSDFAITAAGFEAKWSQLPPHESWVLEMDPDGQAAWRQTHKDAACAACPDDRVSQAGDTHCKCACGTRHWNDYVEEGTGDGSGSGLSPHNSYYLSLADYDSQKCEVNQEEPRCAFAHSPAASFCPGGYHVCTLDANPHGAKGQELLITHGAFCDRDSSCSGADGVCPGGNDVISGVVCGSGQTDSACMHCTSSEPSDCNSKDCIWNVAATAKADGSNMYDGKVQKCEPVDGSTKDCIVAPSVPLPIMCSPCGMKMMQPSSSMFDLEEAQDKQEFAMLKAECYQKDAEAIHCGEYLRGVAGAVSWSDVMKDCGAPKDLFSRPLPSGAWCSAACAKTMKGMAEDWGCCAMTLAIVDVEFSEYLRKQAASCGASLSNACAGAPPVHFSIRVPNLKYAWVTSPGNMAQVASLLSTDIAAYFGVLRSKVTITASALPAVLPADPPGTTLAMNPTVTL